MLSQTGSSTSSNLHRTKSTTSVKDRRKHPLQAEPIDRQTARTDALIAAHRAFDRSRTSTSTELARSESVISRNSVTLRQNSSNNFSPASHLRRQRSTLQNRVPKLADTLRVPGSVQSESQYHARYNYYPEFGAGEETYGAEPSSYRRLRHSRSLLTPVRQIRQPYVQSPENSLSRAPTLRTAGSPGTLNSPGFKLRLRRSLHFLRPPRREADRVITAPAQLQTQNSSRPEVLALARSQYLQTREQPLPKKKSSFLFSVRSRREPKVFVEDTKDVNAHEKEEDNKFTFDQSPGSCKTKPISASLSGKLKRLFGRSQSPGSIPPQQLAASKAHFGVDLSISNPEAGFDSYLEPLSQSSRRNSIYIPPDSHPEACDNLEQLPERLKRTGSCSSLSSKSKSRVTSWTNSTDAGSLAPPPGLYEPKRLSVIKEDGGPHQPSSSAGRHIGGVTLFQQPLNIPQGYTVDSQRVYSALVKRIENEQQEMQKTQEALKEIHDVQDQDNVVGHYLFSSPTIRRVESAGPISLADGSTEEFKTCNKKSSLQDTDNESNISFHQTNSKTTYTGNVKFAQSTESVYSRTTNGGTNVDYVSPLVSTDDFCSLPQQNTGIASQLNGSSTNVHPQQLLGSILRHPNNVSPTRGVWRGWMDQQMQGLSKTPVYSRATHHFREHAEIDPDDAGLDLGDKTIVMGKATPVAPTYESVENAAASTVTSAFLKPSRHNLRSSASSSTSLKLREVPRNAAPAPTPAINTKRSQSAIPDHSNMMKEHTSNRHEFSVIPKVLPTKVTSALKARRSQPSFLPSFESGKENDPISAGHSSSPVSTPGRYSVRSMNINRNGQLRKGKSIIGLVKDHDMNDTMAQNSTITNSPSAGPNSILAARLSKPFDMSIPDRNRPFDSTYLGKREVGNGNRLSVAPTNSSPQRPKTYGDLGKLPYSVSEEKLDEHNENQDTTALPNCVAAADVTRTVSGMSLRVTGKRLVSNFLKSRLKQKGSEVLPPADGGPVFI